MKPLPMASRVVRLVSEYTKPTMPLQQLSILLCVMERGEVPMGDLPKVAGVEQSSVSRNVAILGPGLNLKDRGYDLLEAYEDPMYRRRKLVKLSPRGMALKKEIGDEST